MRLWGVRAALAAVVSVASVHGVAAQTGNTGITVSAGIGVLQGSANELVYNPNGTLLSKLLWRYDSNAVFNVGANWAVNNWLALGAKGSFAFSDASKMDDYDYNVAGCPARFCHSNHPDTNLRSHSSTDVYAAGTVARFSGLSVAALVGYKWSSSQWTANGGTANYATLPAGPGIDYKQWWDAPYLGLRISGTAGQFFYSGQVIGSTLVRSHDKDNHLLRNLQFTDNFGKSDMVGANIQLGYNINSRLAVTFDFDHQEWMLAKGPTWIRSTTTGASAFIAGDAAGANNITQTYSLGLKYKM